MAEQTRIARMDRDAVGRALIEAVGRQRRHAAFFDWPDKELKEWGIAQTFKEELERDGMTEIASVLPHPGGRNEPPDCQITMISGKIWGVEITELVDREAVHRASRGEGIDTAWSDEKLFEKFQALVARKDGAQNVHGGSYDVYALLVHVDEDDLPAGRLSRVLGSMTFETRLIDRIYVLLSYDPAVERCPLLELIVVKQS